MIPARASSKSGEPHQSRDTGTICKEKRANCGNEHVSMTLPQTPPHQEGEGTRPNKTMQEDGESKKAKQGDYAFDRQEGGYHGAEAGGCSSPASSISWTVTLEDSRAAIQQKPGRNRP